MDWLRKIVSGKMVRHQEVNFNLDLAYILKNKIIAMSYPSSGVQALYRNKIEDVVDYLETHHKGTYKVFNLTGLPYKKDLFKLKNAVTIINSPLKPLTLAKTITLLLLMFYSPLSARHTNT